MSSPLSFAITASPRIGAGLRLKRGITLIETLAVTAVIVLLSAMLFPVFAGAKDAARSTQCISNLKQLGLAFAMYAGDNDGVLPTPGGSAPLMRTDDEPRDTWLEYSRDPQTGIWRQDGGIWPYVRQRNATNTAENLYSCPNAKNYTRQVVGAPNGRASQGGQNYTMNEYLRAFYPGESDIRDNVPQPDAFATGITVEGVPSLTNVILLFEGAQFPDGTTNRNGSPYHDKQDLSDGTSLPPFPIGSPAGFHSHGAFSNFAFLDGHVKRMKPGSTWMSATNLAVKATNPRLYNDVCLPNFQDYQCGSGQRDFWNPHVSSVAYP